jgi:predicted AlkP superfamily pyrophosphatase or phosphodiesterase
MSADRRIYLDDLLPADAGRALAMGPILTYYPAEGREADAERVLLAPHERFRCWRKDRIPRALHYGRHRRVAPIFCVPDDGWAITTRAWGARARREEVGAHGFTPTSPDMAALFIGHGPAFRPGARLPAFDNVSVYPLLMRLLGLRAEPNDGRLSDVAAALRD